MISELWIAFRAELVKLKHSKIVLVTFIAFAMAPIMGGIFMVIMSNPELAAKSSALTAKAEYMSVEANWGSYFRVLSQAMGVGGIMVFGFVISWLFGREYSDRTANDILSIPVSRTWILNSKFVLYILWCFAIAISNMLLGLIIGLLLNLTGFSWIVFMANLEIYFYTTVLTILIGSPIAFFALWGKGYLAPLGFVALTLVFAQVIAATGTGYYFPWSVPGLLSGAGGEFKSQLDIFSYIILVLTSLAGYLVTVMWWKRADQIN